MFFGLVHVVKILKLETSAILNSVWNAHKVFQPFGFPSLIISYVQIANNSQESSFE